MKNVVRILLGACALAAMGMHGADADKEKKVSFPVQWALEKCVGDNTRKSGLDAARLALSVVPRIAEKSFTDRALLAAFIAPGTAVFLDLDGLETGYKAFKLVKHCGRMYEKSEEEITFRVRMFSDQ